MEHADLDTVHLAVLGTSSAQLKEAGEELDELLHDTLDFFDSPSEATAFFRALRRSVKAAHAPSAEVASLLEGIVSPDEAADHQRGMARVGVGVARDFARRKQVVAETWGVDDVAAHLELTRQAVNDRWKASKLFGFKINGAVRFPIWQFDADQEDGVLPGLPQVIAALEQSQLSFLDQIYWMTSPKPQFGDRTPIDALRDGQVEQVSSYAAGAGVL